LEFVALFSMAIIAGVFSAFLGLGGGIFLVPALTLIFRLPVRVAVGTSLVGIIATSAGVAAVAPKGRGADVSLALRLEVATTAGAIAGSLLAGTISTRLVLIAFGVIVYMTASYILYKAKRKLQPGVGKSGLSEDLFRKDYRPRNWKAGLSVASIAGALSGLLGISGGFIKVPLMYSIMDVPLGIATATSSFMVGITAAASVFIYYGRGDIHPLIAVPVALGLFLGAMLGVFLLPRIRVVWLRYGLVVLLVVMGSQMLWQGLQG
jgi:uncharacterized membrane protein YfcA